MIQYIALIHKDPDSDFGASFPDLPGAIAAAETMEMLREEAEEALAFHIEGMFEDGIEIPTPSSLERIACAEDFKKAIALAMVRYAGSHAAAKR